VAAAENLKGYAAAATTARVRAQELRYVGDKTFYLRDGYWRDSQYRDEEPARDLAYGSEAYFALAADRPQLGPYLALGRSLLLRYGAQQYRIGQSATSIEPERVPPVPQRPALEPNYPNPFNRGTVLRYWLPTPGPVRLDVYGLHGHRVRALAAGDRAAGAHTAAWDGTDDRGQPVASGAYVARLETRQGTLARKLLVVR
jgi:hypothetical protein